MLYQTTIYCDLLPEIFPNAVFSQGTWVLLPNLSWPLAPYSTFPIWDPFLKFSTFCLLIFASVAKWNPSPVNICLLQKKKKKKNAVQGISGCVDPYRSWWNDLLVFLPSVLTKLHWVEICYFCLCGLTLHLSAENWTVTLWNNSII